MTYFPPTVSQARGCGSQGCSTLRDSEHFEQSFDACETGAVAVLVESPVRKIGLADVMGWLRP